MHSPTIHAFQLFLRQSIKQKSAQAPVHHIKFNTNI